MKTNILITINIVVFLITAAFSQSIMINSAATLISFGAITPESSIYTIFTSMFLHAGLIHLFMNMLALNGYGKMSEILFKKLYIFLYFASGLFSGLIVWLTTQKITIGASGAICGLVGAHFVYHLFHKTQQRRAIFLDVVLLVAVSFLPFVSWTGHAAGFIMGAAIMTFNLMKKFSDKND